MAIAYIPLTTFSDTSFVIEMIHDLKKLLTFMPTGIFATTLGNDIKFEAKAEVTETIQLSLQGSVAYLFVRLFNEPYPANPTPSQIEKINAIWVGIGHPENIIPT